MVDAGQSVELTRRYQRRDRATVRNDSGVTVLVHSDASAPDTQHSGSSRIPESRQAAHSSLVALTFYVVSAVCGVALIVAYQCVALENYSGRRVDYGIVWHDFPRSGWWWRGRKLPYLGMALLLAGLASMSWWLAPVYVLVMPAAVLAPLALHNLRIRQRSSSSIT